MTPDPGFVDLRLNRQEGQTEEGFWPSFTDIMMVIVMIFLMAMVILLIRNMELVDQLRATMEAEREAAALAQATGKEKETLADKLTSARSRLALLQQQITRQEALREQQEVAIASQRSRIAALGGERDRLQQSLQDGNARGRMLSEQLETTRNQLLSAQDRYTRLETREAETRSRLSALQQSHEGSLGELAAAGQKLARLQQARETLETERNQEQAELAALTKEHQARTQDLSDTRDALKKTRADLRQRSTALESSQTESTALQQRLSATTTALNETQTRLRTAEAERQRLARLHGDTVTQLSESRRQSRQRGEQLERHQTTLEQLRQEHQTLQTEKTRWDERSAQLEQRNRQLEQDRLALQQLQRRHTELDTRYSGSRKEVHDLRTKLDIQEQALTQAMARLDQANLSLTDMQEDYGDLKLKYDDLVKPARSSEGRSVVEVRVSKRGDRLITQFRESRDESFQRLTQSELNVRLDLLKARHQRGLYVRVIIPDDSGLSYNEAYSFTSDLHRRYDYYFQESE